MLLGGRLPRPVAVAFDGDSLRVFRQGVEVNRLHVVLHDIEAMSMVRTWLSPH
jgi:hypothetical protein